MSCLLCLGELSEANETKRVAMVRAFFVGFVARGQPESLREVAKCKVHNPILVAEAAKLGVVIPTFEDQLE